MAKSNSPIKNLSRFFDRISAPVYFVNSDSTIIYANDACIAWVGLSLEELLQTKCVYTSKQLDDKSENDVKGLTPPPALLNDTASKDHSLQINVCVSKNETKQWRQTSMIPLCDDDSNQLGILVICNPSICSEPVELDPIKCSGHPDLLHNALSELCAAAKNSYPLETLVGTSSFANRLRRQVDSAAESHVDLLISGPIGTGKEHLAKTIHASRSPNVESSLVPIHCSVADQQVIQNNIKGIIANQNSRTFTLPNDHIDQNESLRRDWLLLLNVDQLGEAAQNELLGFFQLPDFPLRIISTSSQSLLELSQAGNFDKELAQYLSSMTIELATLHQRQQDISLLAQALLERENQRRDNQLGGFSVEVMDLFTEFDWPNNIDQLNRVVQQAAANTNGISIEVTDLPDEFKYALSAMRIGKPTDTSIDLDSYLKTIETELITRATKQSKGNKTRAAKLLGISRAKLLRRLQQLGLNQPSDEPLQMDESAFEELEP